MFADIQGTIPSTPRWERHCQAWISPDTWSLIGTRTAARRQEDQWKSRALTCAIKTVLQGDRRRRAAEAGSADESLLASDPPLIRDAWICMRGWYEDTVDRPPPPDRVSLTKITAEREELYRHVPLTGEPIPVGTPLYLSWWMVTSLRMKRSPGRYAGFTRTAQVVLQECERNTSASG